VRAWLALIAIVSTGCAGPEDEPIGEVEIDPTGLSTTYVVDRLFVPIDGVEANRFGLDVDGDEQGRAENTLAMLLTAPPYFCTRVPCEYQDLWAEWTVRRRAWLEALVDRGTILLLNRIKATDLTSAEGIGTWFYRGWSSDPPPCTGDETDAACRQHLDGSARITLDPSTPADVHMTGRIVDGHLSAGPGRSIIQVVAGPGVEPFEIELFAARIEGAVTATTIGTPEEPARLGGAIDAATIRGAVMPAIWKGWMQVVDQDCEPTAGSMPPCNCVDGSPGERALQLFDEEPDRLGATPDGDCVVTLEEFGANSLIDSLLAPDVDMDDDGIKESMSFGLGFTAVAAEFDAPRDPEE
jgi:hypothetical protein